MPEDKKPLKDYYYILGVNPTATTDEIQEAYHNLYEKYGPHVSVSGQDPDALLSMYKNISEAYEVLMDPVKRKQYDQHSHLFEGKADLRNLWGKLTASAGKDEGLKKRAPLTDQEMELTLTIKEAVKGTTKTIKIDEPKPCQDCASLKPLNRLQCPNCRGLGYTNTDREEQVEFPAGTYDGYELRKPGLGKYDLPNSANADLVLRVKLIPHPLFHVLGRDLTITVPVTLYEAVLGAEIDIPTATGKVLMKIQPCTQPGRVYRLKGLGLAGADELVTIDVQIPYSLTEEQTALFRKLMETSDQDNPRVGLFKVT